MNPAQIFVFEGAALSADQHAKEYTSAARYGRKEPWQSEIGRGAGLYRI